MSASLVAVPEKTIAPCLFLDKWILRDKGTPTYIEFEFSQFRIQLTAFSH